MHGRLKVRTTKEQEEAKQKERAKKLQLYQASMNLIFEKRKNHEYDNEALEISGNILTANPDVYSLWNFRKQIILHFKETMQDDELQKLMEKELSFLEHCMAVNPKSYSCWHHRQCVINEMPHPNLDRELMLCAKLLDKDERNFHCWDYRRFVAKKAGLPVEKEIEFTTDKISANFSNFSSWHYRSKLLPLVYSDKSNVLNISEDVLLKELRLVENAVFTDPSDQSAWFYMRWLMKQGSEQVQLLGVHYCPTFDIVTVHLSLPIPKEQSLQIEVDGKPIDVEWHSVLPQKYSTLWYAIFNEDTLNKGQHELKLSVDKFSVSLTINARDKETVWILSLSDQLGQSVQKTKMRNVLAEELASCQQLLDLEPDNKWVITTVLSLMTLLDPINSHDTVISLWDRLVQIDSSRTNYYRQQKEKYRLRHALCGLKENSSSLLLSGLHLTKVDYIDRLFYLRHVDLSHNNLTSTKGFSALRCCKQLNLSYNKLCNLTGLYDLPYLEEVFAQENCIAEDTSVMSMIMLQKCPRLKVLELDGNPIKKYENSEITD